MNIQWYPGHMEKAMRDMQARLKACDCVVYVLDARAPKSCLNEDFLNSIGAKPVLFVVNKADLGDKSSINPWLNSLKGEQSSAITLDSRISGSAKKVEAEIKRLCSTKLARYKAKGLNAILRAMVAGMPNSGKSTLINNLCGYGKTKTGNIPGVTRGTQWVRVNDFLEILDTPGTLPPKLNDQSAALNLAFIGSVRDAILDSCELANQLILKLNLISPQILCERFNVAINTLGDIAKKRGYLLKGGELDLERAADGLIDDFRKGRLGKVTLDL